MAFGLPIKLEVTDDSPSPDTKLDEILDEFIPHHAKLDNGDVLIIYPKTRENAKAKAKAAILESYISKEELFRVLEDDDERKVIGAIAKNELRAELRKRFGGGDE